MADTGKIVTKGLHASAIKYVVLKGLVPNPVTTLNACFISKGFGLTNRHKLVLHGMSTNPGSAASSAYYIFGDAVIA